MHSQAHAPKPHSEKIYVVEDDAIQRSNLVDLLQLSGYSNVIDFPTVDKALEHMGWTETAPKLTQNLPDAIITDNNTGSTHGGLDLLRAAKGTNIVRIMTTAWGPSLSDVIEAGGPEAKHFDKPFRTEQLLDTLDAALNARTRQR